MACEVQSGAQPHPLARNCVECGDSLDLHERAGGESAHLPLEHRPSTLVGYLGAVYVADAQGLVHGLNSQLQPFCAPLPFPEILEERVPVALDGHLVAATSDGLLALDLIDWAQVDTPRVTRLWPHNPGSALAILDDVFACVIRDEHSRLVAWRGLKPIADAPLEGPFSEGRPFVALAGECALVANSGASKVAVIDLKSNRQADTVDMGANCEYASAGPTGIACLAETRGAKRLLGVSASGMRVLIPNLPRDVTWFQCVPGTAAVVWGNGSTMTVRTGRSSHLIPHPGNIGIARVVDRRAFAVAETAVSASLLTVDLSTGKVANVGPLGAVGFTDLAICRTAVVAGNRRELRSMGLKP